MKGALSSGLELRCNAGIAALAGIMLGVAASTSPALADKVGVAAAVNPDAFSSLSGAPKAQLNIGKSIFFDEHINTSKSGLVQVLLVDGSAFTVGPDSDLTIDKFVYDPNKKTGEMVATFSKGVMRFVGGKLSKNDGGVTVNTPQGALAIRGGMFMGQITGPKSAIYSFLYGVSLTLAGKYTVFQPGNSIYVSGTGTDIKPTTQAIINAMMAALTKVGTYNNAGTNPHPGQLTIQTNNYNEIINEATVQQIQDQIAKELASESTTQPQLTTVFSGYAGGTFKQFEELSQSEQPAGTLTNLSPTEFVPLFDPNTQVFQGAGMTLYVNNGAAGGGGASITFAPVDETVNIPTPGGDVATLFFGFAAANSITVYNNTTGNPPTLTDPATNVGGFAALAGFSGAGQFLCNNCDFLKWGGWLAPIGFNDGGGNQRDVHALGLWVAGDIIKDSVGALPITGGATYSGVALGTVTTDLVDASYPYTAHGAMSMSWNFGTRTGQFDVTGFDSNLNDGQGISFGGQLKAPGSPSAPTGQLNQFNGTLTGKLPSMQYVNLNLTGAVSGSFAKGPGQVAGNIPAGVIGNFAISNGATHNYYNASGIFAGSPRP